jgi:site-specific DNA-cytosine methylase
MVEMLDGSWHELSIKDMLKIQGFSAAVRFPAGASKTQKAHWIGNAVPPPLAAAVLSAVKVCL